MWKVSLVYLFAISQHAASNRVYKVVPIVTGVQLKDNLNYLNSSAETNTSEKRVDFAVTVKKPMEEPWMNIVVWLDVASGALQTPLQNKTFNFCKFIRNPSLHRLGQILLREVKRCGNVPTQCPIAPILYQFRNISTSAVRLPSFLPEANFIMDVLLSVKNEVVYNSRWYGMLKRVQCTSNTRC